MYQITEMTEQVEEKVTKQMIQTEYQHVQKEKLDMDKALTAPQKEILKMVPVSYTHLTLPTT